MSGAELDDDTLEQQHRRQMRELQRWYDKLAGRTSETGRSE